MISLKSQITAKVLNYYFLNPQRRHYINELARILRVDPKNLDRKLKELESQGLLQSEFAGKQRYFFLVTKNPLVRYYRRLVMSTIGIEGQLRSVFQKVKGLREGYIFGSYAKNRMDAGSDIDVLAVGQHSVLELQKHINAVQRGSGREINVVNMSEREFKKKRRVKDAFFNRVFSGKLIKLT